MGGLYWQLNDCWPVASWASIDYYGRWKALNYYARRFYNDVLVSPYLHDDKVDVYVINDKLQAMNGTVHIRLLDFEGKVLFEQSQEVSIPAQSSAIYLTLNRADLATKGDLNKSFLAVDLQSGGSEISHNSIFFNVTHDLALPVSPKIDVIWSKSGAETTVTLKSAQLARDVYLSFGDYDVRFSDNYFDLMPNEPVTLTLKTTASADQLKQALQVTSLTDAFIQK
jgi:beta-mannosidase